MKKNNIDEIEEKFKNLGSLNQTPEYKEELQKIASDYGVTVDEVLGKVLNIDISKADFTMVPYDTAYEVVQEINYLDPRVRGIWRPIRRELTALDTVTHRSFPDFLHNCL